ncbi:hypothetical protein, partial [Wohlfahrtiimonas populi]|uniref:hypothetical protein n=1 Tax=Wohlfahrtiimonas populi TaxID=1940240 RepID=UPI0013013243
YVGREIDGIDEQFINTMGTNNIIALRYDDEYIVMPEKLGIKIITDWCAENATNPEIPTLCEQLKQKYEVE